MNYPSQPFTLFNAIEVKNVIALIAEKNQLSSLEGVKQEKSSAKDAKITTAAALDESKKSEIVEKIEAIHGSMQIMFQTDPNLIGGVKMKIGDREVDNSIRAKLNQCLTM